MARTRITGIVTPFGAVVGRARQPDGRLGPPSMGVRLSPWRVDGGPIRSDALRVDRTTWLPLELWRLILPVGKAVALTVELEEGSEVARLVGYRFPRSAPDLHAAKREWLANRRLKDPRFGTFAYNDTLRSFEGRTTWCGREVELSVAGSENEVAAEGLAVAHRLFDSAGEWDRRISDAILAELFALYNDNWRDPEAPRLSAEEFLARLRLEHIAVNDEELVHFYYEDGDLFLGHTVDVALWLQDDEIDVGISG